VTGVWPYFLETSTARAVLQKEGIAGEALREAIPERMWSSSEFVIGEFVRGVIHDGVLLYYVIKDFQDVPRALEWWEQSPRVRQLKDYMFLYQFLREDHALCRDYRRALRKLRRLLGRLIQLLRYRLRRLIDDEIECPFSSFKLPCDDEEAIVEKMTGLNASVRNEPDAPCRMSEFLARPANSRQMAAWVCGAQSDTYAADRKHKGFRKLAEQIEKHLNGRFQKRCRFCQVASDVPIALECPPESVLVTLDQAFDGLCTLGGKKCKVLPSVRGLHPEGRVFAELRGEDEPQQPDASDL